jgi:para-aminobenzoate synthetase component 1
LARVPAGLTVAAVRRGDDTVVGATSDPPLTARGRDAIDALDHLGPGFWVGFCTFELGHSLERVKARQHDEPALPEAVFARLDATAALRADGTAQLEGTGDARAALEHALTGLATERAVEIAACPTAPRAAPAWLEDNWQSSLSRDEHAARVHAVLEHLAAGDCYEVNITRRLTTDVALDPVALYGRLTRQHPAPHTAMLRTRIDDRPLAIVSASPERYLRVIGREVITQPIKGTGADSRALEHSRKDRAENVIVVDLARNDLGRVCVPGSIEVPSLCAVEAHPGLHHLVSTVRGRLRPDVGFGRLVAATFPPASVTGAPKPRVLQIIEELEPVRRGPYCGAIGWIDTERGEADLAVAIRTFAIFGEPGDDDECTQLGVGGGIVADSVAASEWCETELKASRLLSAADVPALVAT